jgi:segregation and condensation protein B
MQDRMLMNVIEAGLLAAGRPVSVEQLLELFDERERPEASEIRAALTALQAEYAERGIELKEVASGFRIQVRRGISATVSRLWQERPRRYSRALLETLALIAYRQPITRGEIEEVRGVVVSSNIVRTLLERSWVRVVGHRDVPGRPAMFGTTREFLDYFGLKKLDDLPPLSEIKDFEDFNRDLGLPEANPQADLIEALETAGDDYRDPFESLEDELLADADTRRLEDNIVPISRTESGS